MKRKLNSDGGREEIGEKEQYHGQDPGDDVDDQDRFFAIFQFRTKRGLGLYRCRRSLERL
ncbi:hypothetical protein AKJ65_05315 [candidate division MSBL1 archaeon SCGC-AAA259E19]|uniref:Uncharacterized protein n=1 Tax=candidate division MSBL1 archaeon SCGC-AAA259E19 TaxID=1698264 RepID=A0A133UIV7_9EURY|nr:hypothetical protein AKJ65_05315 [candidate division MSBL1 archaeon SCGC-AAA259E19]